MERLTFEVHDGGLFVKESDIKTFYVEDEVMHTGNAVRRLAEYEDLEEQGRLLKLPCAVGDTVYEVQKLRKRIQSYEIIALKIGRLSGRFYYWEAKGKNGIYGKLDGFASTEIGKTVFLTREKAEAALKELAN